MAWMSECKLSSPASLLFLLIAAGQHEGAHGQCCPDGSTPACAGGTFQTGPPPACSNGATATCPTGTVGPGQACSQASGGSSGLSGTEASATGCATADGTTCAADGSTRESITSGLSYSSTTGKFTGTLKGNMCPPSASGPNLQSTCKSFSFPMGGASQWSSPPYAAGLRGTIAFTFTLNYIYGPMDAGFGSPTAGGNALHCNLLSSAQVETCNKAGIACCPPGTTAAGCEDKIRYECETGGSTMKLMFLDACGFHTPTKYHAHVPPRCEYNQANPDGHSPIVGIALDGYGFYGIWETATTMPDLDACNGHTGPVPANGNVSMTASSVYHYHGSPYPPFTMGCFGPVSNLAACKALYTECSDSEITFKGRYKGGGDYTTTVIPDCPCFYHNNVPSTEKVLPGLMDYYGTTTGVDANGYNTAGSTVAANGYTTSGMGTSSTATGASGTTAAPAPGAASGGTPKPGTASGATRAVATLQIPSALLALGILSVAAISSYRL